jgi:predicted RNase H-like HicB family nuclease
VIEQPTDELARYVALEYETIVEPDDCGDAGPCFFARHPELRGCASHGRTPAEAIANLQEARKLYLRTLFENGVTPPLPKRSPVGAGSNGSKGPAGRRS